MKTMNELKRLVTWADNIMRSLSAMFVLVVAVMIYHGVDRPPVHQGQYLHLKDIHGQAWTIKPSAVERLTPDFANPGYVKLWFEGGGQVILPIEQRETIERMLR